MSTNIDHTQLFARIRLHGLTKSSNGDPRPIDLERRTSFPMLADYTKRVIAKENVDQNDKDFSPRYLAPRYDIEARVCFDRPIIPDQDDKHNSECSQALDPEGALGAGRAGIVYPLEILSFKHAASQTSDGEHSFSYNGPFPGSEEPLAPPTLPPLCIKVATPGYARNLAREAWFYEQLDAKGLTGLIVPRCYGVFHASNIPDGLTIDISGYDYYKNASTPIVDDWEMYTARLRDEHYRREEGTVILGPMTHYYRDDMKKSYAKSEWSQFRETPEVTTMTVLVMDMLGAQLTIEDFEKDWDGELNDIYDHLLALEFVNDDIRLPNVLKVPPHLQVPCPMHPNAIPGHRWNLTDWENGRVLGQLNTSATWGQRSNLCYDYGQAGGKQVYKAKGRPKRRKWGDTVASAVRTVGSGTV